MGCIIIMLTQFNVVAYNPIGRSLFRMLQFPVNSDSFEVLDKNGTPVAAQVMTMQHPNVTSIVRRDSLTLFLPPQVIPISEATLNVRRYRGNASNNIVWSTYLPGMGGNMYFIRPTHNNHGTTTLSKEHTKKNENDFQIENEVFNLCL